MDTSEAEMAVGQSDIVCTATSSSTPVLKGKWLKEGTHINAVGSFKYESVKRPNLLYIWPR